FRTIYDFHLINSVTIKSAYPLYNLEADINNLVYSCLTCYLKSGASNKYWAVLINPVNCYKTKF
ncbi:hypothetical protein QBC46DRAFT_265936, partial [Diplogelasinospora grovesii]